MPNQEQKVKGSRQVQQGREVEAPQENELCRAWQLLGFLCVWERADLIFIVIALETWQIDI